LLESFCLKPFFKVRVVVPPVIGALAPDAAEAKTRITARAATVAAADKIDPDGRIGPVASFIGYSLSPLLFPIGRLQGENGEGGNRTHDTTIFSRELYQLSYLAWKMRGQGRAPTGRLAAGGTTG
jgi:hypothetical protein